MASGQASVQRRRLFYVHGFDPRGPAPYHRMFTEEGARQAAIGGYALSAGPRQRGSRTAASWDVTARWDGVTVETHYDFLRWDDLARTMWTTGERALWREMWRSTGAFIRAGALTLARRPAKAGYWAILIPALSVTGFLICLLLAMLACGFTGAAVTAAMGAPWWAGAVAAALPLAFALRVWRKLDSRLGISWISRGMAFILNLAHGRLPDLKARAGVFAGQIAQAAQDNDCDEILIAAHSHGTPLAMLIMEQLLARLPATGACPPIALLTLGQNIATVNHMAPEGGEFHQACAVARDARTVFWLDVTSPSDGASSCRFHPLRRVGEPADRPVRCSPMFHAALAPEVFRRIRPRPFEYHFQYLKATDAPGAYDYFRLTCGPDLLSEFETSWTRFREPSFD